MAKPRNGGKRALAVFLFLLAFVYAAAVVDGDDDWKVAMVGFLGTAGAGALVVRSLRRDAEEAKAAALKDRQLAVLRLAEAGDGQVTVTEVAATLGWSVAEAEDTLRSLDDGVRVTSTLTDEGIFLYEFPELIHDPGRRRLRS